MKKNNKGFTLIELLAVIIILGVLLLIAIPAVSKYIDNSKKSTYISSVKSLTNAVSISVNALELPFVIGKNQGLIVPFSEIDVENKNSKDKSPYAEWVAEKSYVLVFFDGERYDYYVSALDKNGYAIPLINEKELTTKSITTDSKVIESIIISYNNIIKSDGNNEYDLGGFKVKYDNHENNIVKLKIKSNKLVDVILDDNIAYADNVKSPYVTSSTGIDFSKNAGSTNGQGLYYTNKNTEDGKTTYYFRGNVNNNYVQLGEDVVETQYYCDIGGRAYTGASSESECLAVTKACVMFVDSSVSIDEAACDDAVLYEYGAYIEFDSPKWLTRQVLLLEAPVFRIVRINEDGSVRLMLNDGIEVDLEITLGQYKYASSNMKNKIDEWYSEVLSSYTGNIVDAGFCNDTGIILEEPSSDGTIYYYGYGAREDKPQFACPRSSDLYTLSGSTKGNKKLTYAVGLLSADEANYTRLINSSALTMTPYQFYNDGGGFVYFYDLGLNTTDSRNSQVLHPVINVKGDVKVIEGNGTSGSPYKLQMN